MQAISESKIAMIKKMRYWGFDPYNIARAFYMRSVSDIVKNITPCECGVDIGDGWLMEELMRMGLDKWQVAQLFGTYEKFIDIQIERYYTVDWE